jgi:hypothetical protein
MKAENLGLRQVSSNRVAGNFTAITERRALPSNRQQGADFPTNSIIRGTAK